MSMILYAPNTTDFRSNGLGILAEALRCECTEVRNGAYEVEMQYPVKGRLYSEIRDGCIIMTKPSPYREPEPFEIYRISAVINGKITCYAHHVSYQLSDIPVDPFAAGTARDALAGMAAHAAILSPFSFSTDLTTSASFTVPVPSSTRSILGGQSGSILDVYGGEFEWKGYHVCLHRRRGRDTGAIVSYGKNLTDLEQDRNISNVLTGIYPYWCSADGSGLVTVPGKIIRAPGEYGFERVRPVDFSAEWTEPPTPEQLQARAERYVKENRIGVPRVHIKASFIRLEQALQYADSIPAEQLDLCDTVQIRFAALRVDVTAKITKIIYDCITEQYVSVEIGDVRPNLADQVVTQQQDLRQRPKKSEITQAVGQAANWATGGLGGNIMLAKNQNDQPCEQLFMDTDSIDTAQNIWRANPGLGGLSFSSTGYVGPYRLAITQDGQIMAEFIAGVLAGQDGTLWIDLDRAELCSKQGDHSVKIKNGVLAACGADPRETVTLKAMPSGRGGQLMVNGKDYYAWITADSMAIRKRAAPWKTGSADEVIFDAGNTGTIGGKNLDTEQIKSRPAEWRTITLQDGTSIAVLAEKSGN